MMSRKMMITSVLLVAGYCLVYYVGEGVKQKNTVLRSVLIDVLEEEKAGYSALKSTIESQSLKSKALTTLSNQILKEAEVILSIIEKSEYKNTEYMVTLFERFNLDESFLSANFSDQILQFQLYKCINKYLSEHLMFLKKDYAPLSYVKMRLNNRYNSYQVNEMHRLDFQFYENYMYGNQVKYYYEIKGVKKRIKDLPLVLDYLPERIDFSTQFVNSVTGEMKTTKSVYLP